MAAAACVLSASVGQLWSPLRLSLLLGLLDANLLGPPLPSSTERAGVATLLQDLAYVAALAGANYLAGIYLILTLPSRFGQSVRQSEVQCGPDAARDAIVLSTALLSQAALRLAAGPRRASQVLQVPTMATLASLAVASRMLALFS